MENLERKTKAELIELIGQVESFQQITEENFLAEKLRADDLQKKLDASLVTDSTEALTAEVASLRNGNAALREIVELSCQDHCPHHRQEEACQNCEIKKRLDAIGK